MYDKLDIANWLSYNRLLKYYIKCTKSYTTIDFR